eukprot:3297410-Pyramimonas_sp.AAC.1
MALVLSGRGFRPCWNAAVQSLVADRVVSARSSTKDTFLSALPSWGAAEKSGAPQASISWPPVGWPSASPAKAA